MPMEQPTSCILCLEADELVSMLEVQILGRDGKPKSTAMICIRCARQVAGAMSAALNPEVPSSASNQLPDVDGVAHLDSAAADPRTDLLEPAAEPQAAPSAAGEQRDSADALQVRERGGAAPGGDEPTEG